MHIEICIIRKSKKMNTLEKIVVKRIEWLANESDMVLICENKMGNLSYNSRISLPSIFWTKWFPTCRNNNQNLTSTIAWESNNGRKQMCIIFMTSTHTATIRFYINLKFKNLISDKFVLNQLFSRNIFGEICQNTLT